MKSKLGKLILKDGSVHPGQSFGAARAASGEVVFATGMVGYPEALTDPSFAGQILVLTYPLIGNYGVPKKDFHESSRIQVAGLIVSSYIDTPSHASSVQTLAQWLAREGVPALVVRDTRLLAKKLRDKGTMLGKIEFPKRRTSFSGPNLRNLVKQVSVEKIDKIRSGKFTVALIDCGAKRNILRRLLARDIGVTLLPWDADPTRLLPRVSAVVISNGPGDPTKVNKTINNVKKLLQEKIPVLGICLGNQVLALAAGGTTYKLKFGHRSQNQPVVDRNTGRCYLTTQNHGFAVKRVPRGFKEWFYNANDNTNEGIIHESLPFMSVQFHPESSPGPLDTDWVLDYFLKRARIHLKHYGKK